ncbi:uncharacterized protein LOC129950647 [Eupeodes corollae]|uniref:uncharacterized protein LOC129950647 n=1 Tax=Eupeodes corollae TaxID=290404 RepID=UPI002492A6E8|nr:uncharacterized protein LOC129950647 [Eupeodes corollae]
MSQVLANKSQIDLLTSFMEAHPDLAKSFSQKGSNSRNAHRILWEKLEQQLNANGPPSKSCAEWKRFWTVRKYNAKQKLIKNKKSITKTGGGPFTEHTLDANEEVIVGVCGMEAVVNGISGVSDFGCEEQEFEGELNELIGDTLVESEMVDTQQPAPAVLTEKVTKATNKNKKIDNENMLAQKQIQLQEKFIEAQKENFDQIIKSLDNINMSIKDLKDSVQTMCQIKEKENQSSNALKREELTLKRMELELSKAVNES